MFDSIRELLFIFIKTLKVTTIGSFIFNWLLPLVFIFILVIFKINILREDYTLELTIVPILLGFSASILTMLLTIETPVSKKLRETNFKMTNISLHKSLIYKYGYVCIILSLLLLLLFISSYFDISLIISYISIYLILNSILVLMESLVQSILVYSK